MPDQEEQAVKISARLYSFRDTARNLLGDEYESKISGYRDILRRRARDCDVSIMEACMWAMQQLAGVDAGELGIVYVGAATVDIHDEDKQASRQAWMERIRRSRR